MFRKLFSVDRSHRRTAFTLIELLVVIAIIALLAAILFPVFARARENARKSSCANNMKEIGIAIAQYTQDYDETMPYRHMVTSGTDISWKASLQSYIKSVQVFRCPSNSKNTSNDALGSPISYGPNTRNGATDGWGVFAKDSTAAPVALSDITTPASVIMVLEMSGLNGTYTDFNICDSGNFGVSGKPELFSGHLSQANYIFADGHVKSLKPLQTLRNGGSGGVNYWSRDNSDAPSGWNQTAALQVLTNSEAKYN